MSRPAGAPDQGAAVGHGGTHFRVWAPKAADVQLELVRPRRRAPLAMEPVAGGYHERWVPGVGGGAKSLSGLDGQPGLPDPASRLQPDGVHGASEVVATRFDWPRTPWRGVPTDDLVLYELHVGTFTPRGTFDAAARHLGALRDLGVTAVEVMPVNAFPGRRNWGYDGVALHAVQASYGGPQAFKRFVAAAHRTGLAVLLDVVYNHFGPEGAYAPRFGPYFTDRHHTPWGPGPNVDGPDSGAVRKLLVDDVRQWIGEYRLDGLRLDAVHAIRDDSPRHILGELTAAAHALGRQERRKVHMVSECSTNDDWMVVAERHGGRGMDATWADDVQHVLDVLLSGERDRWRLDYRGAARLARSFREPFLYHDILPDSDPVGRAQPPRHLVPPMAHVAFAANHDQVGNRAPFTRPAAAFGPEAGRFALATVLLGPHLPLLFMGEEYAEPAPFHYFTDHSEPDLAEAVRQGRAREFPHAEGHLADPQDPDTFRASVLDHSLRRRGPHRRHEAYVRELLRLRRTHPALRDRRLADVHPHADARTGVVVVVRGQVGRKRRACLVLHARRRAARVSLRMPGGPWRLLLDAADDAWGGEGAAAPPAVAARATARWDAGPWAAALYEEAP